MGSASRSGCAPQPVPRCSRWRAASKEASGIPLTKQPDGLWAWAVGLLVRGRKLRSQHRINLFYGGFFVAFAVLTVVFYMHATKPAGPGRR